MKQDKNIDLIFKEKLQGHKVKAPTDAWSRLEQKIDNKTPKKINGKWSTYMVIALITSSTFLLGGHVSESPAKIRTELTEQIKELEEVMPSVGQQIAKDDEGQDLPEKVPSTPAKDVVEPLNSVAVSTTNSIEVEGKSELSEDAVIREEKDAVLSTIESQKKQSLPNKRRNIVSEELLEAWQPLPSKGIADARARRNTGRKVNSVKIVINIPDSLIQQPKLSSPGQKTSKMKQIFLELIDLTIED